MRKFFLVLLVKKKHASFINTITKTVAINDIIPNIKNTPHGYIHESIKKFVIKERNNTVIQRHNIQKPRAESTTTSLA